MIYFLLNSGGKDSNFFNYLFFCYNFFIKIKNCYSYFENKYSFFNNKYLKKKLFFICFNNEYLFFLNKYKNIDFYCNKLIKLYLIKKIFNKKIFLTGHYFKRIKKNFFSSIDQKKDQNYFLNYKNNIFSINGYFNKNNISFFSIKNNFFCFKKKSTTGICFKKKKKYFLFFFIIENKMIFNIFFFKKNLNLGKKFFYYKILKIKNKNIIISNYKIKYLILKIKNFLIKNVFFKINSQSIKKNGKIIMFKNDTFLLFYKKNYFLENNILILYNDLIINNFKIKKKN